MNKILLSLFLLCLFCLNTKGQVAFDITSVNALEGETIDVDVSISNFDDIVSIQFSLNWDASVYSFVSVENVATELPMFSVDGNIGTPPTAQAVDDGELTVSWSQVSTEPATVPDGTRLFTLRLSAVGSNCSSSTVMVSNTPRSTEVVNINFEDVGFTQSAGDITIDDGTCGPDTMMMNMDGVGLIIDDLNAMGGSSICIPVTTENFTDVASIQTGLTWNSSILRFTGINDAGLTNITANEANADNGELRLLWVFDTEAITLDDGATIFELCFDVIGSTGQTSPLSFVDLPGLSIEVASGQGMSLDFFTQNADVTVGSGGGEQTGVGLIAPDLFTGSANSICVPVSTRDFEQIAAVQSGISFDPNVLQYTEIIDGEISNAQIGTGNAANGELRLLWTVDLGSNSVTLDDGAVLFELCFDVVGDEGDVSPIGFINIPNLAIEIVNEDAEAVDFFVDDGSVTIGDDPNQDGDISLFASDHVVEQGDTFCVDITVDRFNDIQGMGFALSWDESVLRYLTEQNFGLPNLAGSSNFNFVSPNTLRVLWTPPNPASVGDGTVIFQVCYEAIGNCSDGSSTAIEFVGDLNPIEIVNADNDVLEVDLNNGMVTIDTCSGPTVDLLLVTNPSCMGNTDGAIAVNILNVTGNVTCVWTTEDGTEISTDCNLVGVPAGTYIITATDEEGMVARRTVVLNDPSPITATATIVDATCEVESQLSVVISGGTSADGSYSLAWSGGLAENTTNFTDIPGGTYSVTITDDNGCTTDTSFTINDFGIALDPMVTPVTNLAGSNGAITLNATNADSLNFAWSTGATTENIGNLSPGSYTVTITNADGCERERIFDVDWGAVFADDIVDSSEGTITCNGESDGMITGDIIGGCDDGAITVLLDGAPVTLPVTGLSAGSYEITVQDACGNTDVQTVNLVDPPAITTTGAENTECTPEGESTGEVTLNLAGGSGNYTITPSAGTATNDGRVVNLPEGLLNVIVTDENGCEFMIQGIEVEVCVVPLDCSVGRSIISPNGDAMNDNFEIGCLFRDFNQPNQLSIFNRWGELVFSQMNYDNSWMGTDMDGTALDEGGYHWVLDVGDTGQREIFRGTVTILR